LEVHYLGQEGSVVNIRAKRVAPGVPVAFLVKAIAGTYRRYMPEIEDVCLAEYDPGESIGTAPSETFEPVFQHKPVAPALPAEGIPVVNLAGLNRRDAVRALENAFAVWKDKSPLLGVTGLEEDAPGRAAAKWASVYEQDYEELEKPTPNRWTIVIRNDSEELQSMRDKPDEVMPGKIFLLEEGDR